MVAFEITKLQSEVPRCAVIVFLCMRKFERIIQSCSIYQSFPCRLLLKRFIVQKNYYQRDIF